MGPMGTVLNGANANVPKGAKRDGADGGQWGRF